MATRGGGAARALGWLIAVQVGPVAAAAPIEPDGAQAIRKALAYETKGCDVFIIAAADTVMSRPNAELAAEIFPDVEVRGDLGAQPVHGWTMQRMEAAALAALAG